MLNINPLKTNSRGWAWNYTTITPAMQEQR
jgi:hypothetical protein